MVGEILQEVVKEQGRDKNEDRHFVGRKDAILRDVGQAKELFARIHPTHVLHLAAKVGGLFGNSEHMVEFLRENAAINDAVLHCCHEFGVKKLVSCLSTCIFPDKTTYPIDESMLHAGIPHASNAGYAMAKRMIDVMNRCYADEYGCYFTSVIPTNLCGPSDNYDLDDGHVIPDLIHKCYLAKRDNRDFVVSGSGKPLRQFLYSRDMAHLLLWVVDKYESIEPIILSVDTTDEVSIASVAHMIAAEMELYGRIVLDETKPDGQFKKTASNAKPRKLLPDFQFTPNQSGLHYAVRWFVGDYKTARK